MLLAIAIVYNNGAQTGPADRSFLYKPAQFVPFMCQKLPFIRYLIPLVKNEGIFAIRNLYFTTRCSKSAGRVSFQR